MDLAERLLKHIARQPRQTAGFKQLVHELGLSGNERRELHQALRRLINAGELTEPTRDRFAIPQKKAGKSAVTGRLTMHRDGYGFVIPEKQSLKEQLSGDIYVAPPAIGSAMHGDRVLVEMGPIRADGRAEGRIVKVLERQHETVVGIFHYGERNNYVTPIDEKLAMDVIIPHGAEIPPMKTAEDAGDAEGHGKKAHGSRHRVIGEEARRRTEFQDLEGVAVDVEITEFPTAAHSPRGRVVEILGYEDDFGVDVEIIIRKHHLPHRFPGEVLDEAQAIENVIAHREIERRRDYRQLPIVTIDGETARDFDDAVTAVRLPNGNFELQVHIADVAHYVRPDSALDREARLRGNSVYFPDRAVPMLPLELSTDICSLRPRLDRLVLSCIMEIDREGEIAGYELHEGIIRSAERMTYTDVALILEGDAGVCRRYQPLLDVFDEMGGLAKLLNRKRVKRGSIDFDLPEPQIEFDEQGMMRGVTRSERNDAHRLIEEFMLAANECVASYLEERVASIYRIHEKPDPAKVYDFETIAATFGYSLGVGALPVKRVQFRSEKRQRHGSGRNPRTVEIPEEVHITPRMYQKLTQKIAGKPEERILSYLMLRSLKQARYSEENVGHFALAAPSYTHFTSPIRRYPDLIVHRILKDLLHDEEERSGAGAPPHSEAPSPWSKRSSQQAARGTQPAGSRQSSVASRQESGPIELEELHAIAEGSSETERRADDAERELIEWKKLKFMRDRIGEEFGALIVSVTKYGLFVELDDLFIEGLVPLATLESDRFTYRENTREIIGERTKKKYSLGQRVRVLLDRIDYAQRKLQFAIVEEPLPRAAKRHKHR